MLKFDNNLYIEKKDDYTALFCDGEEYRLRGNFTIEFGNFFALFNDGKKGKKGKKDKKDARALVSRDDVIGICKKFYLQCADYHIIETD